MFSSLLRKVLGGALLLALAGPVLAGPPGGPDFGPGPHGWGGPHMGRGPGHGFGLPDAAREIWIGSTLYFLAAGSYYLWNEPRREYVVVSPPPAVQSSNVGSYDVIAYPSRGQPADLQARDRYECHTWAVSQSGFDPASAQAAPPMAAADTYRRALGACLMGRGYTVN